MRVPKPATLAPSGRLEYIVRQTPSNDAIERSSPCAVRAWR